MVSVAKANSFLLAVLSCLSRVYACLYPPLLLQYGKLCPEDSDILDALGNLLKYSVKRTIMARQQEEGADGDGNQDQLDETDDPQVVQGDLASNKRTTDASGSDVQSDR